MQRKLHIIFALLILISHAKVNAQADFKLGEDYADKFVNYQPLIVPAKPKEDKKIQPPPAAATKATAESKEDKESVNINWLIKNTKKIKNRAINNPTKENIEADMYVQRMTMDMAQRYAEKVQEVVMADPMLNENNRIPYASAGALSVRNANFNAQAQAVRELSKLGGLVLFIDGTCRFCALQIPVVKALKREFGLELIIVSIDGTTPKGYKEKDIKTDNGLFRKLSLRLTPSLVYVPSPKGYNGDIDPNRYLIVSQGYYAQDEMVKQLAYAGHKTQLLSEDTRRDLSVWDTGVAQTDDITKLKLDPDKPETFKNILQPILEKQYQTKGASRE